MISGRFEDRGIVKPELGWCINYGSGGGGGVGKLRGVDSEALAWVTRWTKMPLTEMGKILGGASL